MRSKSIAIVLVLLMASSALAVLASSGWTPQGNPESQEIYRAHILVADTHNWYGNTSASASVAANWAPVGVPGAGDNIVFGATATACTFNVAAAFGSFTMGTGSPVVTQAASFSVTSFSIAAGTYTGSSSYTITDSGDFLRTAGTITDNAQLRINMTGASKELQLTGGMTVNTLEVTGSITVEPQGAITGFVFKNLKNYGTLAIQTGKYLEWDPNTALVFTNTGTMNGPGRLDIFCYYTVMTVSFGVINAPIRVYNYGTAKTLTLSGAANLGGALTINTGSGTALMTLDLSTFALTATDITIGQYGLINGNLGSIACSGNWDSSAGTFTQGTSSVHLTGTSKTLKTSGTSSFNKLFLDAGSSYTLQSNVITQQYWKNGTSSLGGHTLYVDVDQAPTFIAYDSSKWVDWFTAYSYTFTASDREGETLTFSVATTLSGLTINSSSGILSKTAFITNGTWQATVSVSDGNHTTAGSAFILDIRYIPPASNHYYYSWTNTTNTYRYWTNNTVTYRYWTNTTGWVNSTMWIGSSPILNAFANETYSYQPTASYLGNSSLVWSMTTNATGLNVSSSTGQVIGTIKTIGTYFVNLTAFDGVATVWQNWTLTVSTDPTVVNGNLVLALVFGFGLIILGFIDRKRAIWPVFAGFIWLVLSVVVLYQFGANQAEHILWMTIGIGIGLIMMLEGSLAYAAHRKQEAG